jgi:SAM-dependent methyltransferase
VADWYQGWVGENGSIHHRTLAIPAVLDLLDLQPNEHILDIGAGPAPLAPFIAEAASAYTGVDASPKLLQFARTHHGHIGRFLLWDARRLADSPLRAHSFNAVVFLLSIQDMDPLDDVIASAAWALKPDGRLIILMTHPCFRVPRQSGWGWDEGRKLQYRRIDHYLTPLPVPMKAYSGRDRGVTRSFHRPLGQYINALANHGLLIERMDEIPALIDTPRNTAEARSRREIPLFLGLRARNVWT